jgi:hypothetical protein
VTLGADVGGKGGIEFRKKINRTRAKTALVIVKRKSSFAGFALIISSSVAPNRKKRRI